MRWFIFAIVFILIVGLFSFRCQNSLVTSETPIGGDRAPASVTVETKWMMIGDSHTYGYFGNGFATWVDKNRIVKSQDFSQYGVIGSTASQWANGRLSDLHLGYSMQVPGRDRLQRNGSLPKQEWRMQDLFKRHHPENLIVALGTNDMSQYVGMLKGSGTFGRSGRQSRLGAAAGFFRSTLAVLDQVDFKRCIWVLPPLVNRARFPIDQQNLFYDQLAELIKDRGCEVIDSRRIVDHSDRDVKSWQECISDGGSRLYPDVKDQIHFQKQRGEYWGHCVALALQK